MLRAKPWYYGRLTRESADALLNAHAADGDYVVRDSESNVGVDCNFKNPQPGDFSISLKAAMRNKHFWVHVEQAASGAQYKIGNRHFSTMDELIEVSSGFQNF